MELRYKPKPLIYNDFVTAMGLFVSVRAKLEPISGGFNSIPKFLLSVGADGTPKRLYFVSADINNDTFVQSASSYVIANGAKSQCMTATKLQNNLPQLMAF